jgi:hypothetical protein
LWIAVRSDGKKAYLTGGPIRHAVVLDTVNDVVLGDCGDKIANTDGVAVRPFWWSTESVEVLLAAR